MTETSPEFSLPSLPPICRICLGADGVRNMSFEEINGYQKLTDSHSAPLPNVPAPAWTVCWVCAHLLHKYAQFRKRCLTALRLFMQIYNSQNTDIYSKLHEKGHSFKQKKLTNYSITPNGIEPCSDTNIKLEHFELGDVNNLELCDERNISDDDLPLMMKKLTNSSITPNGIDSSDTDIKLEHFELGDVNNLELCDERNISDDDLPLMMLKDEGGVMNKVKKKKNKLKIAGKSKTCKSTSEVHSECENVVEAGQTPEPQPRAGFSSRMRQETEEYVVIKLTTEQVLEEMRVTALGERYRLAPHKCALCVRAFNFPDVLHKHMRKHDQEAGEFLCPMCSQRCPSAVSLRGHIKSHTTRYRCKVCSAVRRSRQHLLEHHRTQHCSTAPLVYNCQHCAFNTTKRTVIQRHVRTVHKCEGAQHPCAQCGRSFKTVEALRVHTSRHDKASSFPCEWCGRRFIYLSLLHKHRREVHERKDYYCVECDVHFGSTYNLQLHFKKAKRHRDTSNVEKRNT